MDNRYPDPAERTIYHLGLFFLLLIGPGMALALVVVNLASIWSLFRG